MTSFNISGHEIKDGKLIAIDIELQEPKNTESTDTEPKDSTKSDFIVCANGFFYHYQKIEKTQNTPAKWIRAYLDPADDSAPLHWQEIIFRSHHAFVLAIKPSEVDAIIIDETKEKIKNELQNTKELYLQTKNKSDIADNKDVPKNEADKADNITLAPKEQPKYEGLDDASQSVINAVFALISERPEIPIGYEEKQWEAQWQQGLIYLISHGSRDFEKDLPAHLHEEICKQINIMNHYLKPGDINSLKFYNKNPTIGAAYDYFIHLIKCMISNPKEILQTRKLSKIIYDISIRSIGTQVIYNGLSQAQDGVLRLLVKSFTGEDCFKNCSIEQFEYLCNLLSPNAALTDLDDQILDDFVAIASALTDNHNVFDNKYRQYKENTYAHLTKYKAILQGQRKYLESPALKAELEKMPTDSQEKLLAALDDKLKFIIDTTEQSVDVLKILPENLRLAWLISVGEKIETGAIISDGDHLAAILEHLPKDSQVELLTRPGSKLKTLISNSKQLGKLLKPLAKDTQIELITLLGDQLKDSVTSYSQLKWIIDGLPENLQMEFLITLRGSLKSIFNNYNGLPNLINAILNKEDIQKISLTTLIEIEDKEQLSVSGAFHFALLFLALDHPRIVQLAVIVMLGDIFATCIHHDDKTHTNYEDIMLVQRLLIDMLDMMPKDLRLTLLVSLRDMFKKFTGPTLVSMLELLPEDSRATLLITLGETLKTIIKNGKELAAVIKLLPKLSSDLFLNLLGNQINTIIHKDEIALVLKNLSEISQIRLLTRLGGAIRTETKIQDLLTNPRAARAVKFYSSYPPYEFSDQVTLSNNITNIFSAISNFENKLNSGHLFTKGESIAEEIISKCNENPAPTPEQMINFLHQMLVKIDNDYEKSTIYSYLTRSLPTPTGETAMRIMDCIEKIQLILQPETRLYEQINIGDYRQIAPNPSG